MKIRTETSQLSAVARIGAIVIAVAGFVYLARIELSPPSPAVLGEQLRFEAHAGNLEQVDALLAQGVPVDQADAYGITALIEASRTGSDACVEHLLRAGANVNSCAPVYSTALIQATINHHASTVAILLEHGASPNLRSPQSNSALFWAIDFHETEIARLLKQHGGKVIRV
jgi:ankyrin repeat protein